MTTPTTQREADERALPCPFCGNTDEVYVGVATYCDHCGAEGPSYFIEGKPVAKWNDRAATDQPSAGQVDDASDCTEPNRKACPRLCIDFCNAAEEARASLTPTAPQAADWQNVMQQRLYDLRKDVSTACQLLADNEWAEHFATTPEGRVLESAIAKLVGSAPQAATTGSAAAPAVHQWDTANLRKACDDAAKVLRAVDHPLLANRLVSNVEAVLCNGSAAPVQAAQPALPATDLYMLRRVIECAEKLDERPRPMCRDCADENGTCPNSGLECDMPALIASAKGIYNRLAAPGAAQTTDARDAALEEAAQLCDSLGGDIDERNVDEVKLCANSLAWSIRRLKSDRATHPTDKGQTNE